MPKKIKIIPEVRIEIRPSKMLHGEVGVFSTRKLKKDSIIVHARQLLPVTFFPWDTFNKLDKVTQKKVYGYCSGSKKGFFAPRDLNYISIAWHLNHCCEPDVGFDKDYNFVAMRDIKAGEELCWDYTYDEKNPDFKMHCSCGAKKCRKTITGNDWMFLSKSKRAWQYFSEDMRKFVSKRQKVVHDV